MEIFKDDNVQSRTFFNNEKSIIFEPPVYEQRYLTTQMILSNEVFKNQIRKVVEFGCAELKFFVYLKNGLKSAVSIDFVDIDEDLLERSKNRCEPLICDHLKRRESPLTVNIWKGDIAVHNEKFSDADAVVAIELIEHVIPDVLEEIPNNLFGLIKPKIVILTTPNSDFNVLFKMEEGTFRHPDHKFEWSREQFEDWCHHICSRFPDYNVQFHGIGKAPEGHENLGSCSQLGLFLRKDFLESLNDDEVTEEILQTVEVGDQSSETNKFKLISSVSYPFFTDTRTRHEKILEECQYHVNRYRFMEDRYLNYDTDRIEIPIKSIANACWEITEDFEEILPVIKNNFETENDFVIFPQYMSDDDEIQGD